MPYANGRHHGARQTAAPLAASPPQGAWEGPLRDPHGSCLTAKPVPPGVLTRFLSRGVEQSWTSPCLDR